MRVNATEKELVLLLKATSETREALPLHFGPSGAWLDDADPSAAWAIKMLEDWRNPVCI